MSISESTETLSHSLQILVLRKRNVDTMPFMIFAVMVELKSLHKMLDKNSVGVIIENIFAIIKCVPCCLFTGMCHQTGHWQNRYV